MSSSSLSEAGSEAYFDILGEQKTRLGSGSFGDVYKHARTDKPGTDECLALKVISISSRDHAPEMVERLKQRVAHEIAVHKPLMHPNVVRFLAYRQSAPAAAAGDHETKIILEHCNQGDLSQYLTARGAMPVPDRVILDIIADMQAAVEYLEAHNILHRDIKPENVFRHRELELAAAATAGAGAAAVVAGGSAAAATAAAATNGRIVHKLGDFGLARKLQAGTQAMSQIGTAPWAAPEVTARDGRGYSHECDRFSLGALLYNCEYGELLFPGLDANGRYDDNVCRRQVTAFTGELPPVPAGRWGGVGGSVAVVTEADSRSLRGVMRQIICGLLKPDIAERTTCAQLKAQVAALKQPVLVLDVQSSRVLEVHVPCCLAVEGGVPSIRVPLSAIKPIGANESLGGSIAASRSGGGAGVTAPAITPPTMESVKDVLRAPPYSMEGAELMLLHPDIDTDATSAAGTTVTIPLLLLDGAGGATSFGCDGVRSRYPPLPSSSGSDFEDVRGSSLELADTADNDFGPACCNHLAAVTGWTQLAASLLKDRYAKTVDTVRVTVNTLVDARASAKLATEQVSSLRNTAKEKFKGLKDQKFVVGTTLYSAIYEGQRDAAPPLYDSEGTQVAAFAYLQKQPPAAVMRPSLEVLEERVTELVTIAARSAAGADTIVIMQEQEQYMGAKSALEAHTDAMQAMGELCDKAMLGIVNGEKLIEHITEKKDAAVANKAASFKELDAVHTALFENLVEFQKRDNMWTESRAAAAEAAALQKSVEGMRKKLLDEAQAKEAQAKEDAGGARQQLKAAEATAEQARLDAAAAASANSTVQQEVLTLRQTLQQQAASAAAGNQAADGLAQQLEACKTSIADHRQSAAQAAEELARCQSELVTKSHKLVEQERETAAVKSERELLRAAAAAAAQEVAALGARLQEAEAQEGLRSVARITMVEEHEVATQRVRVLETNIRKHAIQTALAASTAEALATAQQQAAAAERKAAAAEEQARAAQCQQASERQGAQVLIAELETMRAEVGSRPVVGRRPAAGERVILVKQTTGQWVVAGTTPAITVQLNQEADWQSKTRLPFVFAYVIFVDGLTVVVEKVRGPGNELIATT